MGNAMRNIEKENKLINDFISNYSILETNEEIRVYREVWRSVILQAILDATSNSIKKKTKIQKIKALKWLEGDSPDFLEACCYAGFDPEYIQKRIRVWVKKSDKSPVISIIKEF